MIVSLHQTKARSRPVLNNHHLSKLPLKSLHTFCVVAQCGSFKLAAQQLCVTPQAVSLQVKALEEATQTRLFTREPKGIQITASGERLFHYSERAMLLLDKGLQEAREIDEKKVFRINASPWFAVHKLLPRISEFEALYPDVELKVMTSAAFPDFQLQQLDCAIQWGWGQWPSSSKKLLMTDDKLLVCHPALASKIRTNEDLTTQRILCTGLSVALWEKLSDTLNLDLLVDKQALVLDSLASQLDATLNGLGVALLSERIATGLCKTGKLITPLWSERLSETNPALLPGYWLVKNEKATEDPITEAFQDWLFTLI